MQVQGATCTSRKGRTVLQAPQGPSAFRRSQEPGSCAVCSFYQQSWNSQPVTHGTWTTKSDKLTCQLFFLMAICSPGTASRPKQQEAQAATRFLETDTNPQATARCLARTNMLCRLHGHLQPPAEIMALGNCAYAWIEMAPHWSLQSSQQAGKNTMTNRQTARHASTPGQFQQPKVELTKAPGIPSPSSVLWFSVTILKVTHLLPSYCQCIVQTRKCS